MKFTTSSGSLQHLLANTGKVINSKNTYPILDYFLLDLKGEQLTVTASDVETTIVSSIVMENVERDGVVAAPSKLLMDTLKEFADMPITIDVNPSTWEIGISWKSGELSIPGADPSSYPTITELAEERRELELEAQKLIGGVNSALFATADDELRPVMNGVFINIEPAKVTYVATDAHRLVRCSDEHSSDLTASFILPKKPANLLRGMLVKFDGAVNVVFDSKSAYFTFGSHKIVCRLIEGNYPNYNAVIPANNPNKVIVDRVELLNAIRRVAVCSNPTTNLIRLDIKDDMINLQTQDIDFSVSANEHLSCSYEGAPITIGFKSTFLAEILSNLTSEMILIELGDSTRAGVFKPIVEGSAEDRLLMLLMPMMINA